MSDTEIRMLRYTMEQLSAELQATRQYVSDIKTELDRTRKALGIIKKEMSKETMPDFAVIHDALKTALEQKQPTFVHNKIEFPEFNDNLLEEFDKQFFENGQDDDLTETALEQKDVK